MLGYILAVIFGPPVILLVHEIGHLVAARWCGVRVVNVSVGLGKEIFGFYDRHDTRWSLAALPVGGCIKFWDKRSCADGTSLSKKSLGQQAIIFAAGPLANLVLALFLSGLASVFFGEVLYPGAYSHQASILIVSMLSLLSILIAGFNLLPIPPLDGASLSFLATEAVTGKPISDRVRKLSLICGVIVLSALTIAGVGLVIHQMGAYYF